MKKAKVTEPMKESIEKKTLPVDFSTALEITLSSAKFWLVLSQSVIRQKT